MAVPSLYVMIYNTMNFLFNHLLRQSPLRFVSIHSGIMYVQFTYHLLNLLNGMILKLSLMTLLCFPLWGTI